MKAEILESLCNDCNTELTKIPEFWTAEIYSFGINIRSYGFYPKFLPLIIYTDHAPAMVSEKPAPHELNSRALVQFYHDYKMVEKFKTLSKKPTFTLYSPFVYYRKKNKIEINYDALGTIAFPSHSTGATENMMDWNSYIKQLKDLPEKFHPISICLHMHDVNRGLHKIFIQNGFDVYTAGHVDDDKFAERFYNILKKFKYSTSNLIGSYTFYCVEMDIPFFLYGNPPQYYNKWDPNIEIGKYESYKKAPKYIFLENLFKEISTIITKDQRSYVKECLGIETGVSRFKMFIILYSCFFKYCIINFKKYCNSLNNPLDVIKNILKKIKIITRPIRRKILSILQIKK